MLACIHVDNTSLVSPEESSYWNIGSISSTSQRCGLPLTSLIQLEGRVEALIWFKGSMIQPCHLPSFFSFRQHRHSGALGSYLRGESILTQLDIVGTLWLFSGFETVFSQGLT